MERWSEHASSLVSSIKNCVLVTRWRWWQLPLGLRLYVGALPATAIVVMGIAAAHTEWRIADLETFGLLTCCGMISVASTPRIMYTAAGGVTRDFSSVWVLPTAVLLPPFYAAIIPIPFYVIMQLFVHRGVFHRMVFTTSALSLSYVLVSLAFRWFPASVAGVHVGTGMHAFTWAIAVAVCEIMGGRAQHFLIVIAVKLSDPRIRVLQMEWNRDALQGLLVEIDLAVLITLAIGLSPGLFIIALPTVLLVRRFLVHPILVAQSRVDAKTGLLNVSTWEAEAEAELSRAVRLSSPLALALVDIDHFKLVNDNHGHLVGDRVLRAIAEALTGQSRDYDRVGRFGGEEFVLLLAQTTEQDACKIAERLRGYVAALAVPADDRPDAPALQVTISVGVTAMSGGDNYELTDLLAAADSAMYAAKQAGRNQVAFARPLRDMGIDAAWDSAEHSASAAAAPPEASLPEGGLGSAPLSGHRVVLVQADPTGASLCPPM